MEKNILVNGIMIKEKVLVLILIAMEKLKKVIGRMINLYHQNPFQKDQTLKNETMNPTQ